MYLVYEQGLPKMTNTARAGIRYVSYNVDRIYTVMQDDFHDFALHFAEVLSDIDLRNACGMSYVRFYVCQHGMRLRKNLARSLLRRAVDVDHDEVDMIQIHRADTLRVSEDDAILIKLDGRKHDSLLAVFSGAINIYGKTDKYRAGFLADYGYFCRHASPTVRNNIVTFVQAYNSAAKMARPTDSGFVSRTLLSPFVAVTRAVIGFSITSPKRPVSMYAISRRTATTTCDIDTN